MNIILFLNKDIYASLSYNLLKHTLSNHTIRIYYSESVGNKGQKCDELLKLEYLEQQFFNNELPKFIKANEIDSSFDFFDHSLSVAPIELCKNPNDSNFINDIKTIEPDLFISIRFSKIFRDEIINIPKYGLINLHSGILPSYRGILGTLHALKEHANEIGCTLHTIPNAGIDTGSIIDISKLQVSRNKSLLWHIAKIYPLGCQAIIDAIEKIHTGIELNSIKQNLNEGNYYSLPTSDDFDQLKENGFKTISTNDYLEILTKIVLPNLNTTLLTKLKLLINEKIQSFKN